MPEGLRVVWEEDDDQRMLRESADAFLAQRYGFSHVRAVRRMPEGRDLAAWTAMAELGWLGLGLPEAVGGAGLGLRQAAVLAASLGRAVVAEPYIAAALMPSAVLAQLGEAVASRLAETILSGSGLVTLAWQERLGQSDPLPCATRLHRSGNRLRLDGEKRFVPAFSPTATLLVLAMREEAPVLLELSPNAAGVTCVPSRTADGTLVADIRFDAAGVADAAIIAEGDAVGEAVESALIQATIALSAQLEALGRSAFQLTAHYVKQRVQFDRPIADFQTIRHRLVDLDATLMLAGAAWREALARFKRGETGERLVGSVSAAKARASDAALAAAREGIQMHGAFGYTEEADIGLFLDAALRWSSWLGTADVHRRRASLLAPGWNAAHA